MLRSSFLGSIWLALTPTFSSCILVDGAAFSLQKVSVVSSRCKATVEGGTGDERGRIDLSTKDEGGAGDALRRRLVGSTLSLVAASLAPRPALATSRSRTDGYSVQRPEREWSYILSGAQYNILREGGTERPNSSILEGEERDGIYSCAGCGTPLFESKEKFHSGTGWPSFASALSGVEVEQVSAVQMSLLGTELRCGRCGGHLGDIFLDGKLYVGTPAFKSGKRHCIDGAALVFKPADGSNEVIGDTAPQQMPGRLANLFEPPKISAKER